MIGADELINCGKFWLRDVWIGNNTAARDQVIAYMNQRLQNLGFYVGRGWQPYDPVVRPARTYPKIVAELGRHAGVHARDMRRFLQGDRSIEDLPRPLQELALIVCFAEVARGYKSALADFEVFLREIENRRADWSEIKDYFAPALTYAEDSRQEWMPH